jgi:hypothetical protein
VECGAGIAGADVFSGSERTSDVTVDKLGVASGVRAVSTAEVTWSMETVFVIVETVFVATVCTGASVEGDGIVAAGAGALCATAVADEDTVDVACATVDVGVTLSVRPAARAGCEKKAAPTATATKTKIASARRIRAGRIRVDCRSNAFPFYKPRTPSFEIAIGGDCQTPKVRYEQNFF